jgi:two-component system OmpR family sensor kinase
MRIRRRLALFAGGVALAGMAVFLVLVGGLVRGGVADTQDRNLAALADATSVAIAGLPAGQLAPANPLVLSDLSTSTDSFVEVVAGNGSILYSTGQLNGSPPAIPDYKLLEGLEKGSWTDTLAVDGQQFRMVARSWSHGGRTGLVVAGQSMRYVDSQVNGFGAFLLIFGFITTAAVVIISWLAVGRALRPLQTLATMTEEIGRTGDLTRRLPPVRTKDEVGALTASFNGMLDRLAAAQAGLTTALNGQRQFVADASHELRTPLTTIRTNAEFLSEHADVAEPDRVEAIGDIASESARLSELVDDLLLLARADAGAPLEKRPIDLSALAEEVGRKASRRDCPVTVTTEKAIVEGDAASLTRLVWILVDNAVHHGKGRDVRLAVHVEDGRAVLTVADRGPGVPPDTVNRLFERFYRADSTRTSPGSGLGLAIARSIVEAHAGTISVANDPEGGAVFRVRLPLLPAVA